MSIIPYDDERRLRLRGHRTSSTSCLQWLCFSIKSSKLSWFSCLLYHFYWFVILQLPGVKTRTLYTNDKKDAGNKRTRLRQPQQRAMRNVNNGIVSILIGKDSEDGVNHSSVSIILCRVCMILLCVCSRFFFFELCCHDAFMNYMLCLKYPSEPKLRSNQQSNAYQVCPLAQRQIRL